MDSHGRAHVLIVDDDKHLLTTIGDYLEMAKFEVSRTQSGEEALKVLKKRPPDIIVLDICMPGMGGLGFLNKIEGKDGKPRFPVLVLTARAAMESFFKSLEADGFLAKPCSGSELVTEIRAILERRHGNVEESPSEGFQLLLVEDHAVVASRLSTALSQAGFKVNVVETAFDIFKGSTTRSDVIVSKEVLEGMKGSSAAMMAQKHATTKGIPFVLYDASGRIKRSLFLGDPGPAAVDSLVLSNDADAILRAVNGVLQQAQA